MCGRFCGMGLHMLFNSSWPCSKLHALQLDRNDVKVSNTPKASARLIIRTAGGKTISPKLELDFDVWHKLGLAIHYTRQGKYMQ